MVSVKALYFPFGCDKISDRKQGADSRAARWAEELRDAKSALMSARQKFYEWYPLKLYISHSAATKSQIGSKAQIHELQGGRRNCEMRKARLCQQDRSFMNGIR